VNGAIGLLVRGNPGRREVLLRCVETGETDTLGNWAESLAAALGTKSRSAYIYLASITKDGEGKYHNLTFVRVHQ
jgi:hypothetical protein